VAADSVVAADSGAAAMPYIQQLWAVADKPRDAGVRRRVADERLATGRAGDMALGGRAASQSVIAAIKNGDEALLARLLQGGADPLEQDETGKPALFYAMTRGKSYFTHIMQALENASVRVDSILHPNGWTALHYAIFNRLYEIIEDLVERYCAINAVADDWGTPLDVAIKYGVGSEIITYLRNHRARTSEELATPAYIGGALRPVPIKAVSGQLSALTFELRAVAMPVTGGAAEVLAAVPVAEVPVAEVPVAEVPVAEVPVAEVPVAEVPVAEVPVAEVPVVGVPVVGVPVVGVPVVGVPVVGVPVVGVPVVGVPVEVFSAEVPAAEGVPELASNAGQVAVVDLLAEAPVKQPATDVVRSHLASGATLPSSQSIVPLAAGVYNSAKVTTAVVSVSKVGCGCVIS
jgi:hypothetical protein